MGSIAIIDQYKFFFQMIHNTIRFARETNSPFIPWSRSDSLKVKTNKNGQKSVIGCTENIDQQKILFPFYTKFNRFFGAKILHLWHHGHVTSKSEQKIYTVIFKSGNVLEQYPKTEIRVRQSVRWLDHIPWLIKISTVPTMPISKYSNQWLDFNP